ncbi:hypothetical protein B0T26DRAFT_723981 [Lasiosphaeria miniovina]|uniref:Ankyrin repeat protein n=1 Tax=Lasiosphaeria miniovina TaxID=1954250 RepID=A0AA40DNC5_9PEZI|nr:uncharacterized protein B0T26DRAFT_723981 [Lasiosphaeria miniovina]KAK0710074.1 hypothetical protein B0T26DRAFT_723981 [Lasiosphaeria miniovina]
MQWLGFYGKVALISRPRAFLAASVFLGFKFPAWLWAKSFNFEFRVLILGLVRAQNRVPIYSPLMVACLDGDVPQIRQHLRDGVGALGDRSTCAGRTPLMVSAFPSFYYRAIVRGHV